MSQVTKIRQALKAGLELADGERLRVYLGGSEYGRQGVNRLRFTIRVIVGPEDDEAAEERLDQLLDPIDAKGIPAQVQEVAALDEDLAIDAKVVTTTGVKAYALKGEEAPQIGAEWTAEVTTEGAP